VRHDLYGIPDYPRFCHVITDKPGAGLIEFPLSTLQCGKMNIPVAGGGYLRLFPLAFTRWSIRRLNTVECHPAVVYLHPWEIDPEQPRVPVRGLSRFRHYHNLAKMEGRLTGLLKAFHFGSMLEVLQEQGFHTS
jgi:polysaccharide deacetylase family protein (PEP-CTERM system associated)